MRNYVTAEERSSMNAATKSHGSGLPDIEKVAALVHKSWMDNKRKSGVSSRKAEDGEELMVAYGKLSERQKEQDRATVRTVYAAIRELS